jgi:beta-glucosidase
VTPDGLVHDVERVRYLDGHVGAAKQAIDGGGDLRDSSCVRCSTKPVWAWASTRSSRSSVDIATPRLTIKDSGR